jgi:hypothetical protein
MLERQKARAKGEDRAYQDLFGKLEKKLRA